jgi:epoxyqueuosine reductase QueG
VARSASEATGEILGHFQKELDRLKRKGLMSAVKFSEAFEALMPVQKDAMKEVCGSAFDGLMQNGSIVSIAMAYYEDAIESIYNSVDGQIDIESWNIYANQYGVLNNLLNTTAKRIADQTGGIAIPATWEKAIRSKTKYVADYFGNVISHRAIAELAGMGWRGKNSLIVNPNFSCAIRFASIIVPYELEYGQRETMTCGDCCACEDACSFLRNREILSDYRDYCRRYIDYLTRKGVEHDVCGKCIKACYVNSIYSQQFDLEVRERF